MLPSRFSIESPTRSLKHCPINRRGRSISPTLQVLSQLVLHWGSSSIGFGCVNSSHDHNVRLACRFAMQSVSISACSSLEVNPKRLLCNPPVQKNRCELVTTRALPRGLPLCAGFVSSWRQQAPIWLNTICGTREEPVAPRLVLLSLSELGQRSFQFLRHNGPPLGSRQSKGNAGLVG